MPIDGKLKEGVTCWQSQALREKFQRLAHVLLLRHKVAVARHAAGLLNVLQHLFGPLGVPVPCALSGRSLLTQLDPMAIS